MTRIVPSAMPESSKSSVICRVTPPMPAMMPPARPTMFTGSPKSTRFSTQIFAPTSPIIP